MKEIRLGTIGSGVIVRSILKHFSIAPGARLEAVYSRSLETGQALAADFGAQKVYTSLEAFFADEDINCVYIASPNILHYPHAKQALLAGKHVILEKPFCPRYQDALALADLAKEKGLMLVEAVPTMFLPNLEILQRELPKIGRLRLVMSNFSQYSSRYDLLLQGKLPNVFNPAFAGGAFMDLNFYNFQLNIHLFGKPLHAVYYPNLRGGIDTSGTAVMVYPDFVCQATAAKDTWGENFVQFEGELGYIYCTGASSCLDEIRVVTKQGTAVYNDQNTTDRWQYEVQKLVPILLREDHAWLDARMQTTLAVSQVLEQTRLAAGVRFPCDE